MLREVDSRDVLLQGVRYGVHPAHKKIAIPVQGAPAIGKGCLCTYLCGKLPGWRHAATGDELRRLKRDGPQGQLSPDTLIFSVVGGWLQDFAANPNQRIMLVDGAIRSYLQAGFFDQKCQELGLSCVSLELTSNDDRQLLSRGRDGESRADDAYRLERIATYRKNRTEIMGYPGFDGRRIEVNGLVSKEEVCAAVLRELVTRKVLTCEPVRELRGEQAQRQLATVTV